MDTGEENEASPASGAGRRASAAARYAWHGAREDGRLQRRRGPL